jgi:hypothetical protein
MKAIVRSLVLGGLMLLAGPARSQPYPDQFYVLRIDSILARIQSSDGIVVSPDGASLMLAQDRTQGSFILAPQTAAEPFNQGLPSWIGSAPDASSSFMIQMRFPYNGGWSPWLTVGFWRTYWWTTYGPTSYGGGLVDIDYVKLYAYQTGWQFKVSMMRARTDIPTPTLRKLAFFVSDSRTTSGVNIPQLVNDAPPEVFVPTDFIYQYGVDPDIGGSICSPTSVSMAIRSFGTPVDPLAFARATLDPYHGIFGVWPRAVQCASGYGLDGAVTRYRTWSDAARVLAAGGRIVMSVGPPLYEGHLMMLGGFTTFGDVLVHDPAQSDGYAFAFDKAELSQSWFGKGGISYTFHQAGSGPTAVHPGGGLRELPARLELLQNHPNPFNPSTTIRFRLPARCTVSLKVYDLVGNEVATVLDGERAGGEHAVVFDGSSLSSGVYFYRISAGESAQTKRMHILK